MPIFEINVCLKKNFGTTYVYICECIHIDKIYYVKLWSNAFRSISANQPIWLSVPKNERKLN